MKRFLDDLDPLRAASRAERLAEGLRALGLDAITKYAIIALCVHEYLRDVVALLAWVKQEMLGAFGELVAWIRWLLPVALLVLGAAQAEAQLWSGIIAPERATDWSTAGATIIPRNQPADICTTIAAYTGTAATINTAIASGACQNKVVKLGAGTFTLSTFVQMQTSNVTLRGSGASTTKLLISAGNGASTCGQGGPFVVAMCPDASGNIASLAQHGGGTEMSHQQVTATLPAFTQGTNTVTLSTVAGLVVGNLFILDQQNDASDTGDVDVCDGGPPCSNQGGNFWGRSGRAMAEVKIVTAINGSVVTFTPGLQSPNWLATRTQQANWNNAQLRNVGIEDLTIDSTPTGGASRLQIKDCVHCWVTGIRSISNTGGGGQHIGILYTSHLTVRSSYFYGPTTFQLGSYGINTALDSDSLYENNILHDQPSPILPNDPGSGSVFSYNYEHNTGAHCVNQCSPPIQPHSGPLFKALFEGNNVGNVYSDITHGPHYFLTFLRNHLDGFAHSIDTPGTQGMGFLYKNRFFNAVGNVIGHSHFTAYESNLALNANAIFELGNRGTSNPALASDDTNVKRTLFRWCNWDNVTSTNDTASNDQTGTRAVAGEVPSGIANFFNPVPSVACNALPASFYLTAKPSWWGPNPAWGVAEPRFPPIGPDVSTGTAPNTAAAPTGGHADKIPARLCFENTGNDPAYSGSNPPIKLFNAASCYFASGTPPASPGPPGVFGMSVGVAIVLLCLMLQAFGSSVRV